MDTRMSGADPRDVTITTKALPTTLSELCCPSLTVLVPPIRYLPLPTATASMHSGPRRPDMNMVVSSSTYEVLGDVTAYSEAISPRPISESKITAL